MNFFSNNQWSKIVLLLLIFFIPSLAYADDEQGNNIAVTLGWLAISLGLVANLSLVIFKMVRKIPILKLAGGSEIAQNLTPAYKPILNFHIALNSIGFFAGLSHGFMLMGGLDTVSLALVIVMTVSMVSGIILKYASDRNLKIFGRLVHGQFILAVLLVTLVLLHVILHSAGSE